MQWFIIDISVESGLRHELSIAPLKTILIQSFKRLGLTIMLKTRTFQNI